MRIKFFEQLKFRLIGRAVPVVHAADIDAEGKINSLEMKGDLKKRDNSILATWNAKGFEIDPECGMISLTNEKGMTVQAYVTSEQGKTITLYTRPRAYPNVEDIIGRGAMMDDIADAMDIGKSMKNYLIGMVIGIILWMFLGPLFGAMLK
jgi:hypothetical protein